VLSRTIQHLTRRSLRLEDYPDGEAPGVGLLMMTPILGYLVGGIPTPLKNMKVSWDYYSQYMEK